MIGTPEDDLRRDGEELLNFLVPIAFRRLEADGDFAPFGAVVLDGGGVEPVDPETVGEPSEEPDEVFTAILDAIRADATSGKFRTAGLCADVHLVREGEDLRTDAVRIYLERKDGEAMDVFLPYAAGADGAIERGEIFAVEAAPRLFNAGDPEAPPAT